MLQIFVTNNIRIRGEELPIRMEITRALTIDNPAFLERKRKRRPTYGIDPKIQMYLYDRGDLILPRGFLSQLEAILASKGTDIKTVATYALTRRMEGAEIDFGDWNPDKPLREYQHHALNAIIGRNGVLVAPAGAGKTLMGMRYIYEAQQPALWLTHTQDLMYQSEKAAREYMPDIGEIGIIGDGKMKWGDGKLIIATVQTLSKNPQIIEQLNPLIGTLVIDEAHHFPAPAFVEVAGQFRAHYMLGVTATPDRKDALEAYMYAGLGPKLHEVPRDVLYEKGSLIKPSVEFVFTDFDYEQASLRNEINSVDAGGEDLNYRELLDALIYDKQRLELVARKIIDNSFQQYSIVITESVRYCYMLRDEILRIWDSEMIAYKPRMAVVHGSLQRYTKRVCRQHDDGAEWNERLQRYEQRVEQYTEEEFAAWQISGKQRKEIMEACGRKEIDILFATQLAREGLDMPHLTVGHMAMPKKGDTSKNSRNGSSVEQEIGRIMRRDPANPNKVAKWFDYVDYNVGVFKAQYQTRRSVYKRLGIPLPQKKRVSREDQEGLDFLDKMFKGGL